MLHSLELINLETSTMKNSRALSLVSRLSTLLLSFSDCLDRWLQELASCVWCIQMCIKEFMHCGNWFFDLSSTYKCWLIYTFNDKFVGRHRWVEYAQKGRYNASQVPPEWHGWLHHITDHTGDEVTLSWVYDVVFSHLLSLIMIYMLKLMPF